MEKILIIEDDRKLHKPLQHAFEREGYSPDFAADGAAGLEAFRAAPTVLVVLDLQLPKVHGREVCRAMKKEAPNLPIIVLSASTDEVDKVLLLELGADDYVTKPFSPMNLLPACMRYCAGSMAPSSRIIMLTTTSRLTSPRWN